MSLEPVVRHIFQCKLNFKNRFSIPQGEKIVCHHGKYREVYHVYAWYTLPPTFSSHKAQFSSTHKIVEGGRNYTKISLSGEKEKHLDTYMVLNTTRNKTRTKYSKGVS